jgi:tRNA U34 5-carboxymethylaminomethyl modifying GTPase MnmE/TrmE
LPSDARECHAFAARLGRKDLPIPQAAKAWHPRKSLTAGVPAHAERLASPKGFTTALVGAVCTDGLLDRIFSRFCIGK